MKSGSIRYTSERSMQYLRIASHAYFPLSFDIRRSLFIILRFDSSFGGIPVDGYAHRLYGGTVGLQGRHVTVTTPSAAACRMCQQAGTPILVEHRVRSLPAVSRMGAGVGSVDSTRSRRF